MPMSLTLEALSPRLLSDPLPHCQTTPRLPHRRAARCQWGPRARLTRQGQPHNQGAPKQSRRRRVSAARARKCRRRVCTEWGRNRIALRHRSQVASIRPMRHRCRSCPRTPRQSRCRTRLRGSSIAPRSIRFNPIRQGPSSRQSNCIKRGSKSCRLGCYNSDNCRSKLTIFNPRSFRWGLQRYRERKCHPTRSETHHHSRAEVTLRENLLHSIWTLRRFLHQLRLVKCRRFRQMKLHAWRSLTRLHCKRF